MVGDKIKIKKGDKVVMLKGKDVGKSGKILKVYLAKQRLINREVMGVGGVGVLQAETNTRMAKMAKKAFFMVFSFFL